jgi:hypothetical protein
MQFQSFGMGMNERVEFTEESKMNAYALQDTKEDDQRR